jgi:hypothetical protein
MENMGWQDQIHRQCHVFDNIFVLGLSIVLYVFWEIYKQPHWPTSAQMIVGYADYLKNCLCHNLCQVSKCCNMFTKCCNMPRFSTPSRVIVQTTICINILGSTQYLQTLFEFRLLISHQKTNTISTVIYLQIILHTSYICIPFFLVTPGLVVYVWFVVATCFGPILIPLALPGSQKKAKEWVWRGCREQWLQRERLIINDLFNQKSQHLLSESFKWLNPKYQPHFASNESVCTIYASGEGPHRLGKCSRG